jgi:hypothetical protein
LVLPLLLPLLLLLLQELLLLFMGGFLQPPGFSNAT